MTDTLGAFCHANPVAIAGAAQGPLAGLSFAAKDVFDIAGTPTGFGQPDWLASHPPATATASAVQRLLDAGASLVGRTISDEMCYSLSGENVHYGTPRNPRAPGRIPGGSSSGSASATAGGAVDFALGTDCGGSVRVPAGYCGLYGLRTTHGLVPVDGIIPFAGSFDVVGWFARSGAVMRAVGDVLLPPASQIQRPRLLIARALFARADAAVRDALLPCIDQFSPRFTETRAMDDAFAGVDDWRVVFQTVQASEIWANHGDWVTRTRPAFGPGIRERFAAAAIQDAGKVAAARHAMADIRTALRRLIGDDVLCLPTTPRPAPPCNSPADDVEVAYRNQAMALLCLAGLAGLPQLSVPVAEVDGCPVGLSFVAGAGADARLLTLAA